MLGTCGGEGGGEDTGCMDRLESALLTVDSLRILCCLTHCSLFYVRGEGVAGQALLGEVYGTLMWTLWGSTVLANWRFIREYSWPVGGRGHSSCGRGHSLVPGKMRQLGASPTTVFMDLSILSGPSSNIWPEGGVAGNVQWCHS